MVNRPGNCEVILQVNFDFALKFLRIETRKD